MFGLRRSSNWLKSDVMKSIEHARLRRTPEFVLSTETSTANNRRSILKWVREAGGVAQILPNGQIAIHLVR